MKRDEVDAIEAQYVGDVARLEIPLQSVRNLTRVAEELRGLAHRLECLGIYGIDGTTKPGVVMLEVRWLVQGANTRLDKIRGRGRPKRSRNKF